MALAIFGVAVAMLACMQGWNAAAHRKDESTARVMSVLFYVVYSRSYWIARQDDIFWGLGVSNESAAA
jgi:uncharacterized membrane protein YozB (DUF420 family)